MHVLIPKKDIQQFMGTGKPYSDKDAVIFAQYLIEHVHVDFEVKEEKDNYRFTLNRSLTRHSYQYS